jgi:catechol 2,3-dioxygenase-like lactoylglutathione lyase family enzyme
MTLPVFRVVALDCPDPLALADFYAQLTGLEVEPLGDFPREDVDWIELQDGDRPRLGFQKVDHYVAPTWPEGAVPQQLHIDFYVSDLDEGEQYALEVGATLADFQPGDTFRVFLDPVGHPFCLVEDPAELENPHENEAEEPILTDFDAPLEAMHILTEELDDDDQQRIRVSSQGPTEQE